MNRDEALSMIEREYGSAVMQEDREWVEEMVGLLLDDPHYLDHP